MKEKIDLALEKAQFMPSPLTGAKVEVSFSNTPCWHLSSISMISDIGVIVQVRDILSNPDWEAQYSMSIPILKV